MADDSIIQRLTRLVMRRAGAGGGGHDYELPNESGRVDPRIKRWTARAGGESGTYSSPMDGYNALKKNDTFKNVLNK